MKVGLLSDIHCNVLGLNAALDQMDDCDHVICAGDLMYQFRFSNEVMDLLKRRGVHAILGNHDKTLLLTPNHPLRSSEMVERHWLAWLGELPELLTLTLKGVRLMVAHGAPWDPPGTTFATYIYPEDDLQLKRMAHIDTDVVILGHTHVPMVREVGRVLVINPGSCGEPSGGIREFSCAKLDLDTGQVQFLQFKPAL